MNLWEGMKIKERLHQSQEEVKLNASPCEEMKGEERRVYVKLYTQPPYSNNTYEIVIRVETLKSLNRKFLTTCPD
jgi:hypothetical protein